MSLARLQQNTVEYKMSSSSPPSSSRDDNSVTSRRHHCRFDCINRGLTYLFRQLSTIISRYTWPFVIVPIVVTGLLCIGFLRLREESNPEYLYTPTNGPAKTERKVFNEHFSNDKCNDFISSRKLDLDGFVKHKTVFFRSQPADAMHALH